MRLPLVLPLAVLLLAAQTTRAAARDVAPIHQQAITVDAHIDIPDNFDPRAAR